MPIQGKAAAKSASTATEPIPSPMMRAEEMPIPERAPAKSTATGVAKKPRRTSKFSRNRRGRKYLKKKDENLQTSPQMDFHPYLRPIITPFHEHVPTMEASTSSLSPDTAGNAPSLEASSSTHSSTMEKIRPTKAAREPTKRESSQRPIIIGKKVNDGIFSWRGADLTVSRYVGRVAVGTSADTIRASLTSKGVDVVSIESLEMKHNRFVSFKLTVKKSQLSLVEDADIWPEGVMIGRWWSPKAAAPISATVSTIATA